MIREGVSPWTGLCRNDIERLIEFYAPAKNRTLNDLQTEGCYRLWNTLCDDSLGFSYLADEVGMGKTYQALGVIGVLHFLKPDSKVIILCPGREMQKQWSADWHSFFQEKYCPQGMDGLLKARRIDAHGVASFEAAVQPQLCENLGQFATSLVASRHSVYLLRYPSFSLPLRVFDWAPYRSDPDAKVSFKDLLVEFQKVMSGIGYPLEEIELESCRSSGIDKLTCDEASRCFMGIYADRISLLVNLFKPDLVVWDEAQYLGTDAYRNHCIRKIFGGLHRNGSRHLFLSATPAHRDVSDMNSLNILLGNSNEEKGNLIQVKQEGGESDAFRKSVSRWMVRRERSFAGLGKLQYRDFHEDRVDMFSPEHSPLYALTFASMQKSLVRILDGQNNKFRMGEISCNESAKASIEATLKSRHLVSDDELLSGDNVLEESSKKGSAGPIDEHFLRDLGLSFKELQQIGPHEISRDLPHAKVDHVVADLAKRCLEGGAHTKELVFVRRVATVDELADGLLREFQQILNERIRTFQRLLNERIRASHEEENPDRYWELSTDNEDDDPDETEDTDLDDSVESLGPVGDLPYFKALSAVKGKLGRLTKYRNSLGKLETSTIRFLLVPELQDDDLALWRQFLKALKVSDDVYDVIRQDSSKELLLRRCLAHSIRFTDILVDFDLLRRRDRSGYVSRWLEMLSDPPPELSNYFLSTRQKLYGWIDQFDTIVNKCFKGSSLQNSYREIADRVATYFRGLSPVARRSGRRTDENVVAQFKFPVFPNVLICTDVLREGVNLHLFCERVSHYGIAWNSGDLEQRIGRIERADSLFERNILKNKQHKLHVGFPYLARTLDERQVKKAIRRKREIDALFSIIPPKESGECDDSKEESVINSLPLRRFVDLLPPSEVSRPIGETWPKLLQTQMETWDAVLKRAHKIAEKHSNKGDLQRQGFEYFGCRMMGQLNLLAIEWVRLSRKISSHQWLPCDRLIFDTFERKKQWKTIRTLYFPMSQTLTEEAVAEFWRNLSAGISGTRADSEYEEFTFCGEMNSHIRKYKIGHPADESFLTQISYLCRWGNGYAIASPVAEVDDEHLSAQAGESLASELNTTLPFGCAIIQNKHLMLVFPQVAGPNWGVALTASLSQQLAHWACRRRWALPSGAYDENSVLSLPVSGITEMDTRQAINVLSSLRKWCLELNQAIDTAIGDPFSPLTWRTLTSMGRLIRYGVLSAVSEFVLIPRTGKFQIAYSVTGLDGNPNEKKVVFYLAAKPANFRVVASDMSDIGSFLSKDVAYDQWLDDDGYDVEIDESNFHYAVIDHSDGTQFRRLRLAIAVSELENYHSRDYWLRTVAKLASNQLLNGVFQYNAARARMERESWQDGSDVVNRPAQ